MRRLGLAFAICAALCGLAVRAWAGPVGERHLIASDATAALRDSWHLSLFRVVVWYPAAAGAVEQRIDEKPFFTVGAAAQGAAFADARPRPVILLSHGNGGTARIMGWFGTAMARAGYVVIAVDHPGNNGLDKMTTPGALLPWERAQDLAAALATAEADPVVGPHIDDGRVGVAGFSAGGFTALVAAGARVDIARFVHFCHANPTDGNCKPQKELPLTLADMDATLVAPEYAGALAHSGDDLRIPKVRAAFAIAPAIVQGLTPEGLARMRVPVAIILGDADPIATPATNGLVAARLIPHAELKVLPGVGHYDWLATCTPAGAAALDICADKQPQDATHAAAITMALALFARTLGTP